MNRFPIGRRALLAAGGGLLLASCGAADSEVPRAPGETVGELATRTEEQVFDPSAALVVSGGEVAAVTLREVAFWSADGGFLRHIPLAGAADFVPVWGVGGGVLAFKPDQTPVPQDGDCATCGPDVVGLSIVSAADGGALGRVGGVTPAGVAVSVDGLHVAVLSTTGVLTVHDPEGARLNLVTTIPAQLWEQGRPALRYLDDGRLLVAGGLVPPSIWSGNGAERLWEGQIGRPYGQFHVAAGRAVYSYYDEAGALVLEVRGLENWELAASHKGLLAPRQLVLSPDGRHAAFVTADAPTAKARLVYVLDVDSGEVRELAGAEDAPHSVAWAEAGLFTLSAAEGVLKWDLGSGSPSRFVLP